MASLKTMLNAAIKAGSTFAYASSTGINVGTIPAGGAWGAAALTYTAPCDGILQFGCRGCTELRVNSGIAHTYFLAKNIHDYWVPVSKGSCCVIYAIGTTEASSAYFYPAKGQQ